MSFTNIVFLFAFFPICIAVYFLMRLLLGKNKKIMELVGNVILILFSLFFYAWGNLTAVTWICCYLLLVFFFGKGLEMSGQKTRQTKLILAVGVLALSAALFYYKYYNFAVNTAWDIWKLGLETRDIIVPLGISFITFSAISYLVDIYRGDAKAGSLLDAALYITFFPKVISGPIVLWKDFANQTKNRIISDETFLWGLNRMMIGFAKKVILADTFGLVVYNIQTELTVVGIDQATSWGCAFLYMLQIYYDFAGYSDIAIGISAIFGFKVKENFNFPYVSQSITEFWRRWHISLGTWFREYIYIPLGGNRKGQTRTLVNLGIVFLITGIWHGAGLNYIWWGVLHGVFMIIERLIRDKEFYKRIPGVLKWFVTMVIVFFGWQLFRFPDIQEFITFMKVMFGEITFTTLDFTFAYYFNRRIISYIVIGVLGATVLQFACFDRCKNWLCNTKAGLIVKEIALFLLMILSVIMMVNSTYSPFIYFQY